MNEHLTRAERRRLKHEAGKAKKIAEKAKKKLTSYLWYSIVLIVIVGLGFLFVREINKPLPGIRVPIEEGEHTTDESKFQTSSPVPTSGNHYSQWDRKWGFQPKPLSSGAYVHNMEHGGVIILFRPDTDEETLEKIKNFVEDVYGEFLKFDLRNGQLRKKSDSIKWNLKKLEEILYDLNKLK